MGSDDSDGFKSGMPGNPTRHVQAGPGRAFWTASAQSRAGYAAALRGKIWLYMASPARSVSPVTLSNGKLDADIRFWRV